MATTWRKTALTGLVKGVWRSLVDGPNPTRTWRADSRRLVLDLDSHRLADVGIGDELSRLAFLGPAQRWPCSLEYPARGIAIGTCGQRVDELLFFFGHPELAQSGRYTDPILFRGSPLSLSARDDEQTWIARFGHPYWRDEDSDESILFYEFGQAEWQVEFAAAGGLKCLAIARPLLADPQQRLAYGVDRPWPPDEVSR
jgi:hypothetical protein